MRKSFTIFFLQGAVYLKRYDNFHVARSGVTLHGEAASTNAQNYFRFPLEQFSSPHVTPMWPRNYVYLRRLEMWPSTFNQLITLQFNMHGFNLPYRDARHSSIFAQNLFQSVSNFIFVYNNLLCSLSFLEPEIFENSPCIKISYSFTLLWHC